MHIVKQTNKYNCGTACLTMVTGIPIPTLEKYMGKNCMEPGYDQYPHIGLNQLEMSWLLFQIGIKHFVWTSPKEFSEGFQRAWKDSRIFYPIIEELESCTMILSVPSLNIPGSFHWIVWHDSRIFDPSNKKCYKDGDDLTVDCAIIIGENICK